MDKDHFKKTVVETLCYDKKFSEKREHLLPIINRSDFNFIPQYAFSNRISGQHWESLEFRVPVPMINLAYDNETLFRELFRHVYQENEFYALKDIFIKPQIITEEEPFVENNVEFRKIQETIIHGIRDAKYLIWIAVAWFTNEVFHNELLKQKRNGINIRIAVSDEKQNEQLLPKLKENFDVCVIPRYGFNNYNRMHDKFCIVDLDYVMHGSYNWTKVSEYNEETLVTSVDRRLVKDFADEFIRIITKNITA